MVGRRVSSNSKTNIVKSTFSNARNRSIFDYISVNGVRRGTGSTAVNRVAKRPSSVVSEANKRNRVSRVERLFGQSPVDGSSNNNNNGSSGTVRVSNNVTKQQGTRGASSTSGNLRSDISSLSQHHEQNRKTVRAKRSVAGSSGSGGGSGDAARDSSVRRVSLQSYHNILTLIDGLKYQLPSISSELCCPALCQLAQRDIRLTTLAATVAGYRCNRGIAGNNGSGISSNNIATTSGGGGTKYSQNELFSLSSSRTTRLVGGTNSVCSDTFSATSWNDLLVKSIYTLVEFALSNVFSSDDTSVVRRHDAVTGTAVNCNISSISFLRNGFLPGAAVGRSNGSGGGIGRCVGGVDGNVGRSTTNGTEQSTFRRVLTAVQCNKIMKRLDQILTELEMARQSDLDVHEFFDETQDTIVDELPFDDSGSGLVNGNSNDSVTIANTNGGVFDETALSSSIGDSGRTKGGGNSGGARRVRTVSRSNNSNENEVDTGEISKRRGGIKRRRGGVTLSNTLFNVTGGSNGSSNVGSSLLILRRLLAELRIRTVNSLQNHFGPETAYMGLLNTCDCCVFSSTLILYCSESWLANNNHTVGNGGNGGNVNGSCSLNSKISISIVREMFRDRPFPSILFDAALILCGTLDRAQFERDFCLKHVVANDLTFGDTFAHIAKTLCVLNMGFYRRLYVLHLCVHILVNWLWAKQRLLHTFVDGRSVTSLREVPPVTLVVTRDLLDLLRRVETVPFLLLLKTQKVILQTV